MDNGKERYHKTDTVKASCMAMFIDVGNGLLTLLIAIIIQIVLKICTIYARSPGKPLLKCVLDAVMAYPMMFGYGPWALQGASDLKGWTENQVNITMKALGLHDFGGSVQDMARQYDAAFLGIARSKVEISPSGYINLHVSMQARIECRLRMIDFISRHPCISEIPVRRPVFVIGFPRTGTTFLHDMLGLHPEGSSHLWWEQMSPIPLTHDESMHARTADRKKRYNGPARTLFRLTMLTTDPAIQRIHRIEYDASEECTTPCAMELPWNPLHLPFMIFAAKEVLSLGAGNAFNLYKSFLQLLAWQAEDRQEPFTWILKCPFHLPYLTELFSAFPDATVVWTHRDPVECIASACSLYEAMLNMIADTWTIDKHALGQAVMEYTSIALDKAMASVEKASRTMKILHVRYADNVKDPKNICRQVFEKAELPFSREFEDRVDGYLAKNAEQRKKLKEQKAKEQREGKTTELHSYSLEEYGLSEEMVLQRFGPYISKYNLRANK